MERNLHATQPDPRFWNIAVRRERITITSGPLHTPGTSRHIDCKSGEVALKTAQALVDQRLKDGFRDAAVSAPAATMDLEAERALLTDAPEGWLVFADELLSWNASSFWKALRNNGSTRWRTRSRRPPSCSATKRSRSGWRPASRESKSSRTPRRSPSRCPDAESERKTSSAAQYILRSRAAKKPSSPSGPGSVRRCPIEVGNASSPRGGSVVKSGCERRNISI